MGEPELPPVFKFGIGNRRASRPGAARRRGGPASIGAELERTGHGVAQRVGIMAWLGSQTGFSERGCGSHFDVTMFRPVDVSEMSRPTLHARRFHASPALTSTFNTFSAFFAFWTPQNEAVPSGRPGVWRNRRINVFLGGEFMGDPGQRPRCVVAFDHQTRRHPPPGCRALRRGRALSGGRSPKPDDAVVYGVARGDCIDVDVRLGQGVGYGGQHAGAVVRNTASCLVMCIVLPFGVRDCGNLACCPSTAKRENGWDDGRAVNGRLPWRRARFHSEPLPLPPGCVGLRRLFRLRGAP